MRCNAKSKQTGNQCGAHVIAGKTKCKYHGGLSTGPRTPEGLLRCKMAPWKHGGRSKEAIAEKRRVSQLIKKCDDLLETFE